MANRWGALRAIAVWVAFVLVLACEDRPLRVESAYTPPAWWSLLHGVEEGWTPHPSVKNDVLLGGTLAYRMPVDGQGQVDESGHSPLREVLVRLSYYWNQSNEVRAWCVAVPVEAPQAAWVKIFDNDSRGFEASLRENLNRARLSCPPSLTQTAELTGRTSWWVLSPFWPQGHKSLAPPSIVAELYWEDPERGATPAELFTWDRNASGGWQDTGWYVTSVDQPVLVRLVMEDGRPSKLRLTPVEQPPLEDFLHGKENTRKTTIWRNRMLISAKNRTLPGLLRDGKTKKLMELAETVEKTMLDVNRELELAKGRAQGTVESGRGSPNEDREWVILYQERLEVLKPILGAIKEEVANRSK